MARSWRLSDRDFPPTNIYPRKTMSTYLEKADALPAGPNPFSDVLGARSWALSEESKP